MKTLRCADQLYSDVKQFPEKCDAVVDRIAGIEALIPQSCRLFLDYRTGANQVMDWLGEAKALGALPPDATAAQLPRWKQSDQARFVIVNAAGMITASGIQPIKLPNGGNYNPFRKLVDWRGAELLARSDVAECRKMTDANGRAANGFFIDNWRVNNEGSFPEIDAGANLQGLERYVRTVLVEWPGCILWVNAADPHVMLNLDESYVPNGGTRFVEWLCRLGVSGIYYEGYKWAVAGAAERSQIETTLQFAVGVGLSVCVGAVGGTGWEPLYAKVSNGGVEQNVYRSL